MAFFCQYFLWLCLFYQKTKVQIMFVCSFLLFTLFINFLSSCHHVFSSPSTCCCLNVLTHWLFNSLTFFLVLILHDHFHSSLTSSSFFSFSKFNWQCQTLVTCFIDLPRKVDTGLLLRMTKIPGIAVIGMCVKLIFDSFETVIFVLLFIPVNYSCFELSLPALF